MYIYQGKFIHQRFAVNDMITIVFPGSVNVGEKAYAFWQWTTNWENVPKVNQFEHGHVDAMESVGGGSHELKILKESYYRFDGTLSGDKKTLHLTMHHGEGENSQPFTMQLVHEEA
jgi:hypothetical protein